VILVVGHQKLVRDLDRALRRVREYSLPREYVRMQDAGYPGSLLAKTLLQTLRSHQRHSRTRGTRLLAFHPGILRGSQETIERAADIAWGGLDSRGLSWLCLG
jgi:hypothetical protein